MRGRVSARQLRLLQLLESRSGGLEIDEAAAALGIGRRTLYRDFEVLQETGIPLVAEREGKRARWRMMDGYRHRLQISLTWSEVLALSTGSRLMAGLAGTLFHESAVSALEKIRATLPRGLAQRVQSVESRVSTPRGGHDYSSRGPMLNRIAEAIAERWTVRARYRSRSAERATAQTRLLDPYHLRVSEQGIYLVAFCHRVREPRTFLLDRFESVEPTQERFEIVDGFRGEQYLAPAFGMWSGTPRRVRFVVAPRIAGLMMERTFHPSQTTQRRADGAAEVRMDVSIGPPLVTYLAGLGADVSAIQPESLRDQVLALHRESLANAGTQPLKKNHRRRDVRPHATQVRKRVRARRPPSPRKGQE